MLQFVDLFVNFMAGVWTVVFKNTILEIGNVSVSFGEIVIAGLIVVMCINLFWKGAKI